MTKVDDDGGKAEDRNARAHPSLFNAPTVHQASPGRVPNLASEPTRVVSESGDPVATAKDPDSAPPSIPSAASLTSAEVIADGTSRQRIVPGHLIADRYEVLRVLGEGGMGIVYDCKDQATGQAVALKRVIIPANNLAADYVLWFYKEARALAPLDHPSIVRARDFGQLADGSPYLVMDLVEGISLHDLAQARLSFPIVWAIVDHMLSALGHAHARGVIHGDLKPSNVLVQPITDEPPRVHILDFGLAWLKKDPHDERLDGAKSMQFAPHAGAGTPGYMAPEQIQHEQHHVCGATDLYSLGCILYRMLTGRAPFSGDPKELLRAHAFDPVPEPVPAIDAPPGVAAFIVRMLAKRPWDRWEFAAEARHDWSAWRPRVNVDPRLWEFPALRRSDERKSLVEVSKAARKPKHPQVAVKKERAPGLLSIRPSPLVGRQDIRTALREISDEVIDSVGAPHRLVILVGAAGTGKSRIAEWLCEVVHEEGTMIPLRARYRPLRGPLDGMLGAATQYFNFERTDRDTIERSLLDRWKVSPKDKNGRAWVAGAAEWFRPGGGSTTQPVGPSGVRFTFDSLETRRMVIRYTIRRISRARPLLFWLDDLHHAGQATFDGFLRIHSDEPDQRIMMVATVRAEDVHLGTPAADRLRHLRQTMNGHVIDVPPLEPEMTHKLLRESLPLDDAAVQEAARRSRGNPLFALQQLHAWALSGNLVADGGLYRVPEEALNVRPKTTAELWDSRVAALPEEHRIGAYAASPLSGEVRQDVLLALLKQVGLPAEATLESLQTAEILIPRGTDRYNWPHALLQEHLLRGLDERTDKRLIYMAAADALSIHPAARTRRIVRQRVVNLLHASEPEAAAALLFDFFSESWDGRREPLATLHDLELLSGRVEGRAFAFKNRWQGEALRHLGRVDEAREHGLVAKRVFEELGDRDNLGQCLKLLGHLHSDRGESARGAALINEAWQLFIQTENLLGQAQCAAVQSEIEYLTGLFQSAQINAEKGDALFEQLDQPLGRGQCLLLMSWVAHARGRANKSREFTLQARQQFERTGYRLGVAHSEITLAHVEHRLKNFHAAETGAQAALSIVQTLRIPRAQGGCERLLAMVGIDTDDAALAFEHASLAAAIYAEIGDPWGILESKLLQCQVCLMQRELVPARALLEECAAIHIEEAEPRQHLCMTQAWFAYLAGSPDEALAHITKAAKVFESRTHVGDHTPHLLARFGRLAWPKHGRDQIETWHTALLDRSLRDSDG